MPTTERSEELSARILAHLNHQLRSAYDDRRNLDSSPRKRVLHPEPYEGRGYHHGLIQINPDDAYEISEGLYDEDEPEFHTLPSYELFGLLNALIDQSGISWKDLHLVSPIAFLTHPEKGKLFQCFPDTNAQYLDLLKEDLDEESELTGLEMTQQQRSAIALNYAQDVGTGLSILQRLGYNTGNTNNLFRSLDDSCIMVTPDWRFYIVDLISAEKGALTEGYGFFTTLTTWLISREAYSDVQEMFRLCDLGNTLAGLGETASDSDSFQKCRRLQQSMENFLGMTCVEMEKKYEDIFAQYGPQFLPEVDDYVDEFRLKLLLEAVHQEYSDDLFEYLVQSVISFSRTPNEFNFAQFSAGLEELL